MSFRFLIITILFNGLLDVYGQDFQDFSGGVKSVLLKEYGKDILGEGKLGSDGLKTGNWIFYTDKEKGIKHSEGNYLNGKKNGVWMTYQPNKFGRLKSKETYSNDTLFEYLHFDYLKRKIIEIKSVGGLYGNVIVSVQNLSYKSSQITSALISRGFSTQDANYELIPMFSKIFNENQSTCEMKYYTEDNLMIDERRYENGYEYVRKIDYYLKKINKETYYQGGYLTKEIQYIQTNPNNFDIKLFYQNEGLKEKKGFRNKKLKHGKWVEYYENGKKKSYKPYNMGVLHGTLRMWDESGDIIKEEKYKKGQKQ